LAHDLAHRKGLDESLSLAEVAQRVSQAIIAGSSLISFATLWIPPARQPNRFFGEFVTLVREHQIETVITTAYDNLLELAFQQAGIGLNRVVRGSDVNFIEPDRPTLIKLYGDAQQPDTLVVTDQDHSKLLPLIEIRKQSLTKSAAPSTQRCPFPRLHLTDPDFRFLFDQIAESRFARLAYAVWAGIAGNRYSDVAGSGYCDSRNRSIWTIGRDSSIPASQPKQQKFRVKPQCPNQKETKWITKQGLTQLKKCLGTKCSCYPG